MPGFDRTGPEGQGPMTGRGLGRCNPDNEFNEEDDIRFGRGWGRGRGLGRGRGFGRGFGGGYGRGFGGGRRFRGGNR